MGVILIMIFEILMVSGTMMVVYRLWKKADLKDQADKAETVEAEFATVKTLERNHKDLSQKSNRVSGYKNKRF